jgi:predicted ester cyclase
VTTPPRPPPVPPTTFAHAPESIQPAALDREAWVEFLAVFLEGFPDLHLEVLDSSADEVMVAQRIHFTGTHTGTFRGLPATGNNVWFSGLEINGMVDGRVAEHWFQLDAVTIFDSSDCISSRTRGCSPGS